MRSWWVAIVLSAPMLGCKDETPSSESSTQTAEAPAPLEVTAEALSKGMVLRYLAPNASEVLSAASLDAIPESARGEVIALDAVTPTPPGGEFVANLGQGLPANAVWRPNFRFVTQADQAPVQAQPRTSATPTATHKEVVLFSTEGCGYCQKARRFLERERIPFTELDVETNPRAPARLQALASKAGVGPEQLSGVPILFVDGQPMLGWNEGQLRKMLSL